MGTGLIFSVAENNARFQSRIVYGFNCTLPTHKPAVDHQIHTGAE